MRTGGAGISRARRPRRRILTAKRRADARVTLNTSAEIHLGCYTSKEFE
jgi:hypothetical protein